MTIRGDTQSFDLADLLQSFETHGKSGTLTMVSETGEVHLQFVEGKIAALHEAGRPSVSESLAAGGWISERQLENSRKKRGRSRRPLCEFLVGSRVIAPEQLLQAAEAALFEAAANTIAAGCGSFQFAEGESPADLFDAEEQSLNLRLAVGPLLLEAARRKDHWALVRQVIPSDTAHFIARPNVPCPDSVEDLEHAQRLLAALDGTRSVHEVVLLFPQARFQTYLLLNQFVREKLVRAAVGDDLAALAQRLLPHDKARARRVVRHGLEGEPHHVGLLQLEARLAEALEDAPAAAAALKQLAHLKAEAAETEEAEKLLAQAKRLSPGDPAIFERTLALLLDQGRRAEAVAEGMRLAELYREPGLHSKARDVLTRLVDLDPSSLELRVALARELVDCGEGAEAVRALLRHGKQLVAGESYAAARTLFEEVLAIDASNKDARWSIQMIDKETFARRRERRRRLQRRAIVLTFVVLLGVILVFEARARADYLATIRRVSEAELIEQRRYDDALQLYRDVAERHPMTLTTCIDVKARIQDLEQKLRRAAPR
jgi:tetratricopeptide (TPR) repeat protein